MARIKGALNRRTRRKKLFRRVRGFFLGRKRLRQAIEARLKADAQMFVGRKQRKRQFRRLWIVRINAAAREHGLSYSRFIAGLKEAGIEVDRKVLADIAMHEKDTFAALAKRVQPAAAKAA